jgi:hypothetical protein
MAKCGKKLWCQRLVLKGDSRSRRGLCLVAQADAVVFNHASQVLVKLLIFTRLSYFCCKISVEVLPIFYFAKSGLEHSYGKF